MGIDHGKLASILGSEIAATETQSYSWRTATESDIGRLARFADRQGDDWNYGMLTNVDRSKINVLDVEGTFGCTQIDGDDPELFFICEVQEVLSRQ